MRRALLWIATASGLAACFPAYEFASAVADGGPDQGAEGGGPVDATTTDAMDVGAGEGSADASLDAMRADAGLDASQADAPADAPADTFVTYDGPIPVGTTVIPAGSYGFDVDNTGNGGAFLDAGAQLTHGFAIDDYEVTVNRFKAWVVGGSMATPADQAPLDNLAYASVMTWSSSWNGYATDTGFMNAGGCTQGLPLSPTTYASTSADAGSFPVSCINWFQAVAFCAFDGGKRLPTDTEWRIAAQGGNARSTYPWGNSPSPPDCRYATMNDDGGCGFPVPVGSASLGHTPDGVYDLAGSLPELVWDRVPQGSTYRYPSSPQVDYTGMASTVATTDSFVVLESAFFGPQPLDYSASGKQFPWTGSIVPPAPAVMGFRCAKSL